MTAVLDFEQVKPDAWIDAAVAAKFARRDLKRAFPGVKFSVRTDKYSGGSSIDVRWVDGPTSKQVDAVVQKYGGAGFDGMIDLKYHYQFVLLPNGDLECVGTSGTTGSAGTVPAWQSCPTYFNAKPVSLGNDYVFCTREVSRADERREVIARRVWEHFGEFSGRPFPTDGSWKRERFGNDWLDSLVQRILSRIDFRVQDETSVKNLWWTEQ